MKRLRPGLTKAVINGRRRLGDDCLATNEQHLSLGDEIYLLMAERTISVPAHWPAEIGNAAVNLRRGRLQSAQLIAIDQRLGTLDVVVEPPPAIDHIKSMVTFAAEHGLTVYDAAYVMLAQTPVSLLQQSTPICAIVAQRLNVALLPAAIP